MPPVRPALPQAPPDAWRLKARTLRFQPADQLLIAEGAVRLETPERVVHAARVELHVQTGVVRAVGPVVVAESAQVLRCEEATLNFKTRTGEFSAVTVDVYAPMDAATRDAVARLQGPQPPRLARASGARVQLLADQRLRIQHATLTTCDCKQGPAPLSVTAQSATVAPGDYALLWLPMLRIMDVPVAVAPVWVVPLGTRQSGLLFPQFRLQDGLWIQQPVFVTLGDSADITVAPAFVTERGPRLFLEGRAAPAHGTEAEVQFTYQRDAKHLWQRRDRGRDGERWGRLPARLEDYAGLTPSYTARGERLAPDRLAGRLHARSRMGPASLAVDGNMASDRYVPGDFGASLGDRVAPYLRSAASVSAGMGDVYGSASVLAFQDLRQPNVAFYGPHVAALAHRVPQLQLRILEAPLLPNLDGMGPALTGRALLSLDHEAIWGGALGMAATQEDFARPGRRAGSSRLVLQPEVNVPLRLGRFGGMRATLGVREMMLLGADGRLEDVTRVFARARAETELSARWAAPGVGGMTHRLRPYVAYDGTVFLRHSAGTSAAPWMDAADRVGRYQAVGAGLAQELVLGRVMGRRLQFSVDTRGAVDALNPRQAELQASGRFVVGDAALWGRVAADPWTREWTFLQGALDVGTTKGPQVHVGYARVGRVPPRFMVAGADELLGGVRLSGPVASDTSDRLDGFVAVPVGRVRLDWGLEAALPGWDPSRPGRWMETRPTLLTHGGGVSYESECRCWSAGVRARFWPDGNGGLRPLPDLGLQFSLAGPGGEMALFR
jgi:hypothetical protein